MGFFDGIAKIIKAPFEGVANVVKGVGEGIGSILHGSKEQTQPPQQYVQQSANQVQGQDPQLAMQMLQFQNALMMNMLLKRALFGPGMLGGGC